MCGQQLYTRTHEIDPEQPDASRRLQLIVDGETVYDTRLTGTVTFTEIGHPVDCKGNEFIPIELRIDIGTCPNT